MTSKSIRVATVSFATFIVLVSAVAMADKSLRKFAGYDWELINGTSNWEARAGLKVVAKGKELYLMGGRTPIDPLVSPVPGASQIWGDVWKSKDQGKTWNRILESGTDGQWAPRAYFQSLVHNGRMYVLGGQNFISIENPNCPPFPSDCPEFISSSEFFSDVWRSKDGVKWEQMTDNAGWSGRAGLSAIDFKGEIFVMAGSQFDDSSIIGGPPVREYYNDVWKSADGENWELVTAAAPWAPRAGGVLVKKNGYMYMIGGEDGFTCLPGLRCPPYYNDVWRSKNGADWELVTANAPWSPRPGHQVVVFKNSFVLFGGFGLSTDPTDPFKPSNPIDVWVSKNGLDWSQLERPPWGAVSPAEIKYDFAAVAVPSYKGQRPAIMTFGGDRETFDFTDLDNWLNIDNDVWRFMPVD